MLILAIDTSTMAASAAVLDENKLHGEIYTDYKLKHSEKILPLVDTLMNNLHISMPDIEVFALSQGPGSFTGLRIEAATAKAFAHAAGKPIIGVSTLEACAYGQLYTSAVICPILDAQQDSVYTALFKKCDHQLVRLSEDQAISKEKLLEQLSVYDKILFCGDAVIKFRDYFARQLNGKALFADPLTMMPRASCVGMLALSKTLDNKTSYRTFLPNYIRVSQAEANYEIKLP